MAQTKKKGVRATSKNLKKKGSTKQKTPGTKATTGSTKGAKEIRQSDILDREITASKLDTHLNSRPHLDELKDQQIVPPDTGDVSSVFQSSQHQRQRQMQTDKVSKMLNKRPDKHSLQNQGVLKDGNTAPALQAAQVKLRQQLNADQVHRQLSNRPSPQDVINQGILPSDVSVMSPALVANAKALERNMVQDQVNQLLETRPNAQELITQHIVEADSTEVAPAIQAPMHQLQRHMLDDKISQHLKRRPSREDLLDQGVLVSKDDKEDNEEDVPVPQLSRRSRYAIALKATARLFKEGLVSEDEKYHLKTFILSDDHRVAAAIECFEFDRNGEEMLDTFLRIAKLPL